MWECTNKIEHITEWDMHGEFLEELERQGLFETDKNLHEIRDYLRGYPTLEPIVNEDYLYSSMFISFRLICVSHFEKPHRLIAIQNGKYYFQIDETIKTFPEQGEFDAGSLLKYFMIFDSKQGYEQTLSDLMLHFMGDGPDEFKFTLKKID